MKRVTFWFVTGSGLVPQTAWINESVHPADIGSADFVYNANMTGSPNEGRISIQMAHVAFWTYD